MPENEANRQPGAFLAFMKLIGYLLCFALPTVALSLLFSGYTGPIVLGGFGLLFAVSAFILGLNWDNPEMPQKFRDGTKWIALMFAFMWPALDVLLDVIHFDWRQVMLHSTMLATIAATVYIPFFLARAISRRRAVQSSMNH